MIVITKEQIEKVLCPEQHLDQLLSSQRKAFIDYSNNKFQLPIPMQLQFIEYHGDCHIKAGYKEGDEYFLIKAATGFYSNWKFGLPAGDGVILVFAQKTGVLEAILLDGAFLTIFRTALAACIAASLTPYEINNIGIIGTGNLAFWVIKLMRIVYPMKTINIWGRNPQKAQNLAQSFGQDIKSIELFELCQKSNLLITTTASHEPIITEKDLHSNMHIVSLGADEPEKHEVDLLCFKHAQYVIVDAIKQAIKYGDVAAAIKHNLLPNNHINELGCLLNSNSLEAQGSNIILTCFSGIAAQDIAITNTVLGLLNTKAK